MDTPQPLKFEWDPHKAELNAKRHRGITFDEAATVFDDPVAQVHYDPDHSDNEDREIIVGLSNQNRPLLVSYTERRLGLIRIISARKLTPLERTKYENET